MHSIKASNLTKLYRNMKNISFYEFLNIQDQLHALYKGYSITGVIIFIAGAFLSLWFLVAIFHSQKVRSRLRNKIICNTFLLILLDCLLMQPMANITTWHLVHDHCYHCIHTSLIVNLGEIQNFMENWILVMLLAIFIVQIRNVFPPGTYSQRTITVSTSALLVLPWIVSFTIVPLAFYTIAIRSENGFYNKWQCLYKYITPKDIAIFKCIDTAIPLCLSLTLVIIAALLRHRRLSRGNCTNAPSNELISPRAVTEIDSAYVYGIAVIVSIVCDFPEMLASVIQSEYSHITRNYIAWQRFMVISATMGHLRVVLLPLVWLLFPDIRQQIKPCKPSSRQPVDADMTVIQEGV